MLPTTTDMGVKKRMKREEIKVAVIDGQGGGVGRALVGRAMDALRAQGIRKATLVAFARNELGNAFWQRMGFAARGDLTYRDAWLNKTD